MSRNSLADVAQHLVRNGLHPFGDIGCCDLLASLLADEDDLVSDPHYLDAGYITRCHINGYVPHEGRELPSDENASVRRKAATEAIAIPDRDRPDASWRGGDKRAVVADGLSCFHAPQIDDSSF